METCRLAWKHRFKSNLLQTNLLKARARAKDGEATRLAQDMAEAEDGDMAEAEDGEAMRPAQAGGAPTVKTHLLVEQTGVGTTLEQCLLVHHQGTVLAHSNNPWRTVWL